MDLLIIVILIVIAVCWFRKFSSFIYALAIIEIFLRLLAFIRANLGIPAVSEFISNYFPASIPTVINTYSTGILNIILMWGFAICIGIFEFYIIRTFFHKS